MANSHKKYLVTYRPLCHSKEGRAAVEKYKFPPYIDASCRREPDLQSLFPSISALCRRGKFAPKLNEGDSIIYVTTKGRYEPGQDSHWRLVAVLRVAHRFESHMDAASWYRERGFTLPSNCMVNGNERLPFDMTGGLPRDLKRLARKGANIDALMKAWDNGYKERAGQHGVFLVCEKIFLELERPPILTKKTMLNVFGRMPPTRTPPPISERQYETLRILALNSVACAPEQNG